MNTKISKCKFSNFRKLDFSDEKYNIDTYFSKKIQKILNNKTNTKPKRKQTSPA